MQTDSPPNEHQRARAWREAAGFSRAQLARLTGYSESSIQAIEAGAWKSGAPVEAATMHTYRLVCAAVALGVEFDWQTARLRPRAVEITVTTLPPA